MEQTLGLGLHGVFYIALFYTIILFSRDKILSRPGRRVEPKRMFKSPTKKSLSKWTVTILSSLKSCFSAYFIELSAKTSLFNWEIMFSALQVPR